MLKSLVWQPSRGYYGKIMMLCMNLRALAVEVSHRWRVIKEAIVRLEDYKRGYDVKQLVMCQAVLWQKMQGSVRKRGIRSNIFSINLY